MGPGGPGLGSMPALSSRILTSVAGMYWSAVEKSHRRMDE